MSDDFADRDRVNYDVESIERDYDAMLKSPRRDDAAGEREKRELLCEVCNREYRVWFAPNPLWNAVVRQSDGDEWEFLCPTCFTNIAAERGVEGTAFEVRLEQHDGIPEAT